MKRTQLPNGCSVSPLSVIPKNWKKLQTIKGPWQISYRFYDPTQPKYKQVALRSMNDLKTCEQRKQATEKAIQDELRLLQSGYNPFSREIETETKKDEVDIKSTTMFITALERAHKQREKAFKTPKAWRDVNNKITHIHEAAIKLGYDKLFISDVTAGHMIAILNSLQKGNPDFSDYTYVRYLKDLSPIFEYIVLMKATLFNFIPKIPKPAYKLNKRKTLTIAERIYLDNYLRQWPDFHRFVNIFYGTGSRIEELVKIKGKDVDLVGQKFRSEVIKGRKKVWSEEWRPIKTIDLPFWREQMKNCGPEDYVFSEDLRPGPEPIRADQITKRWFRLVKKEQHGQGKKRHYIDRVHIIDGKKRIIDADIYSLKHSHTTEVVALKGEEIAAEVNKHTTTKMVRTVYDVEHESRESQIIKSLPNGFAPAGPNKLKAV